MSALRFLILAHPGDETAVQTAARLRERHPATAVGLVFLDDLVRAPHWEHRIAEDGGNSTTVLSLPDGTTLASDTIGVVFNRLQTVEMPHFAAASRTDREYGLQEMFALLLSWLAALPCPVISPISPQGLGGPNHSPFDWQYLAARAGLPTLSLRRTSSVRRYGLPARSEYPTNNATAGNIPAWLIEPVEAATSRKHVVSVIGDIVRGDLPPDYSEPCRRLAALSEIAFLDLHFVWSAAQAKWIFQGANPFPNATDEATRDALVRLLEVRSS